MTYLKQLLEWQKGNSIHKDDECCPDFSCCNPELLASQDERDVFVKAYEDGKEAIWMGMLMGFLGRLIQQEYGKIHVHLAGQYTMEEQ